MRLNFVVVVVNQLFESQHSIRQHLPDIDVDPETYEVRADGVLLTCEPASELPMAQRYFLF